MGLWKLMLRDGLNLYGVRLPFSPDCASLTPTATIQAIWIVNITNVLFWFIIRPTGDDDAVRTIVTR